MVGMAGNNSQTLHALTHIVDGTVNPVKVAADMFWIMF